MTRKIFGGTRTAALAALVVSAAAFAMTAAPAQAMQILEAADHGELAAEISAAGVSRIALGGDRIRRVIRSARRVRGRARSRNRATSICRAVAPAERAGDGIRPRDALHRDRAGLHLPADPDPVGPGLGADPDPQRRRRFGGQ